MRRTMTRAFAMLLVTTAIPAAASAAQVTLMDATVMHTEQTGAVVAQSLPGAFPTDLVTGTDYAGGTLHLRATVSATPGGTDTGLQFCFVQGGNSACSNYADLTFNANATLMHTQAMNTLDRYGAVQWDAGLTGFAIEATDANGYQVDSNNTDWAGSPDFALYYPTTIRVEAVLVAAGDAFEGFPSDQPATVVANPTFSPMGGSFSDSVTVTIASATADAEIRYTTDGSDPDENSALYENPLTFSQDTTLKAIAYKTDLTPSQIITGDYTITVPTNGLRGRYYNGREFGTLAHTRTDAAIEFAWGDGESPAPNTDANRFSVIWSGTIEPLYSETYTIKTRNDDGVRVWVDNQLIIDDWNFHGPQDKTGNIALQEGQKYDIWIEYFNGGGAGTMELYWLSSTQPEEIIPDSLTTPEPQDNSPSISVLLNEDNAEIAETISDPIPVEIRRRGGIGRAVRVELSYGGTAVNGEDYEELPAFIDIAEGELSATLQIQPIIDGLVEEEETIEITIGEGNYSISNPSTQTIKLLDFDVNTFTLAGQVLYTGTESGKIYVEAFTDEMQEFEKRRTVLLDPGAFAITDVEEGDYQVVAYIDTNDNERLDKDELWVTLADAEGNRVLVTPPITDIVLDLDQARRGDTPGPAGGGGDEDDDGCAAAGGESTFTGLLLFGLFLIGFRRRR